MSTPGLGAEALPEQGTSMFLSGLHFYLCGPVIQAQKTPENTKEEKTT